MKGAEGPKGGVLQSRNSTEAPQRPCATTLLAHHCLSTNMRVFLRRFRFENTKNSTGTRDPCGWPLSTRANDSRSGVGRPPRAVTIACLGMFARPSMYPGQTDAARLCQEGRGRAFEIKRRSGGSEADALDQLAMLSYIVYLNGNRKTCAYLSRI